MKCCHCKIKSTLNPPLYFFQFIRDIQDRYKSSVKSGQTKKVTSGFIRKGSLEWLKKKEWRWRTWVINNLKDDLLRICPHVTPTEAKDHIGRMLLKLVEIRRLMVSKFLAAIHSLWDRYREAEKDLHQIDNLTDEMKEERLDRLYGGNHYHVRSQKVLGRSFLAELDRKWIPLHKLEEQMKALETEVDEAAEDAHASEDSDSLEPLEAEAGQKDPVVTELKVVNVSIGSEEESDAAEEAVDVGSVAGLQEVPAETEAETVQGDRGEKAEPLGWKCDETCILPSNWGSKLHKKLESLDPESTLHELLTAIVSLEYCDHCNMLDYFDCSLGDDCQDLIKVLREKVFIHRVGCRTIVRQIYNARQHARWLIELEQIFYEGDYRGFVRYCHSKEHLPSQVRQKLLEEQQKPAANMDEMVEQEWGHLRRKFEEQIKIFKTEDCSICRQLCYKDDVKAMASLEELAEMGTGPGLAFVVQFLRNRQPPVQLPLCICSSCRHELKNPNDGMPVSAEANGMFFAEVPPELSDLNFYELFLIQQVRPFHTIVRLKPMRKFGGMEDHLRALKGLVVHVPLNLEETLHYTAKTLPSKEFLDIIVDSLPTSKNVVWRNLVNLEKVYAALMWLKENNTQYENIQICDDLMKKCLEDDPLIEVSPDQVEEEDQVCEPELDLVEKSHLQHVEDKCGAVMAHCTIQSISKDIPTTADMELY